MNVSQQSNETMVPIKENQASNYALHVALQTMKERCLALQQRLTVVEEENLALRLKYGTDTPNNRGGMLDTGDMNRSENDQLRDKVGELTRQKHQLTEHIGMVASENRQLWSRLSKLTKDNQTLGISLNKIKDTLSGSVSPGHQNLIRSKTFTQNSPNPILRQKLLQDQCASGHAKSSDNMSMEEIVLKDFDDIKDDVNAPNRPSHPTADQSNKAANSLGFGYLNDESINTILQNESKKCIEDMVDIKRELLRQQSDLKVTVSAFRQRREICQSCQKRAKGSTTVDKIVGTSDEETDSLDARYHTDGRQRRPIVPVRDTNNGGAFAPIQPEQRMHIDILQEKRMADCLDKMCPMCGKIYSNTATFEVFQEHVESHFIDDTELDMSVEKNFEYVSNTVGHF